MSDTATTTPAHAATPRSTLHIDNETLRSVLRPHQTSALHFLWRRLVDLGLSHCLRQMRAAGTTAEQRAALAREVYGAILGHSMGLGKTLTALSFLLLLQRHLHDEGAAATASGGERCRRLRVLVVCPRSTTMQWRDSVEAWVRPELFGRATLPVRTLQGLGAAAELRALRQHHSEGGVLLMGYEEFVRTLRRLERGRGEEGEEEEGLEEGGGAVGLGWVPSLLDGLRPPLPPPLAPGRRHPPRRVALELLLGADAVVLDEAHRLRRFGTALVGALERGLRRVQLRLALTGTPLQNHLEQYHVMQSVVCNQRLDLPYFLRHVVRPIERGQCADASYAQVLEMTRCVGAVRHLFGSVVHHCGAEVLAGQLPPRRDLVFFVRLAPAQTELYTSMVRRYSAEHPPGLAPAGRQQEGHANSALQLFHEAAHVCFHPAVWDRQQHRHGRARGDDAGGRRHAAPLLVAGGATEIAGDAVEQEQEQEEEASEEGEEREGAAEDDGGFSPAESGALTLADSTKLAFAVALVRHVTQELREKVLVFAQYRSHIDALRWLLAEQLRVPPPPVLTGQQTEAERRASVERLTKGDAMVLICSLRAGGVGIDASAANHCILLNVSWNPTDDSQASCRCYRLGQRRPVTVYRLCALGTIEHVVFFYAMQRSWMHRKIAEARDPRRQERHVTHNYARFPCDLPLPDGAERVGALATACPPAARALAGHPALREAVVSAMDVGSLLEGRDTAEAQAAHALGRLRRAREQEEAARRTAALAALPASSSTDGSRAARPLTEWDECDAELQQLLRRFARAAFMPEEEEDEEEETGSDDEDNERSQRASRCAAALAQAGELAAAALAASDGEAPRPAGGDDAACGAALSLYRLGVRVVVRETLSAAALMPWRNTLRGLIPAGAARRLGPRLAPGESLLEHVLSRTPSRLLRGMDGEAQAYLCTELGFARPLEPQCVAVGLRLALARGGPALSAEVSALLAESSAPSSGDSEDGGAGDVPPYVTPAEMAEEAVGRVWPPYVTLELPPRPFRLRREERLAAHAARAAARLRSRGLLTLEEAAPYLGLARLPRGHACGHCPEFLVVRRSAAVLECPNCHRNYEAALASSPRVLHHAVLYRLSRLCHLLEAVPPGAAPGVAPAAWPRAETAERASGPAAAALEARLLLLQAGRRRGPGAAGARDVVRRCVAAGADVLLLELPAALVARLQLQAGVEPGDGAALRRLLLANSRLLYELNVRPRVREEVRAHFQQLVGGGGGSGGLRELASMPLMLLLLGLCSAARREGVRLARELLESAAGDGDGAAAATTTTAEMLLLRFVASACVKLRHAELLRLHLRRLAEAAAAAGRAEEEQPSPPSSRSSDSVLSFREVSSDGDASTVPSRATSERTESEREASPPPAVPSPLPLQRPPQAPSPSLPLYVPVLGEKRPRAETEAEAGEEEPGEAPRRARGAADGSPVGAVRRSLSSASLSASSSSSSSYNVVLPSDNSDESSQQAGSSAARSSQPRSPSSCASSATYTATEPEAPGSASLRPSSASSASSASSSGRSRSHFSYFSSRRGSSSGSSRSSSFDVGSSGSASSYSSGDSGPNSYASSPTPPPSPSPPLAAPSSEAAAAAKDIAARSAELYWRAFSAVYGWTSVPAEGGGVAAGPAPPGPRLLRVLKEGSADGLTVTQLLEDFVSRLMAVSASFPLIKQG